MNRSLSRSLLRSAAQLQLDALVAQLSDDAIVYTSTLGAGQVLATATGDLLPQKCRGLVLGDDPDFEAAARCFIDANSDLLLDADPAERGSAPDLVLIANAAGGEIPGTEQFLRFEQRHLGVRVEHRSMAFVFREGRLTAVTGRYAGTASFSSAPADTTSLLEGARSRWGAQVEEHGLVYNPNSRRPELITSDGLTEHRIDAIDGEVLRTGPLGAPQFSVTKTAGSYTYPTASYLGQSETQANWSMTANCTPVPPGVCDVGGTGSCWYMPVPNIGLPDPPDKINELNVTYVTGNETAISVLRSCGSATVFTTYPFSSYYTLEHYALSARRAVDDLEAILNHSESFFWVYPRTPFSLKLNVNEKLIIPNGDLGLYTPKVYGAAGSKINLQQDPSPYGYQHARIYDTITHEYGHYVHDSYDYEGTPHVLEGWGMLFPYRVAIHKRFVTGEWPAVSYSTSLQNHGTHRYNRGVRQGEMVQVPVPPEGAPPETDLTWLWYPNAHCATDDGKYECGRMLFLTYWVLAFDQCKLNFMNCTANADIIRFSGGYQNSAWRLANSAYAYALKNMSGDGNIDEFHALVGARYGEFRASGYIDVADENRVLSVLASHCLGSANVCPVMHRLPNSPLPAPLTEKHALFKEAESASRYGTATLYTGVPATSGGQYVNLGSNGDLVFTLNITVAGKYRVHFVTKPTNTTTDEVMVWDPGSGVYKNAGPLTPLSSAWVWRSGAGTAGEVTYSTTGSKQLYLSTYPSHMNGFILDAIWLEWVSVP